MKALHWIIAAVAAFEVALMSEPGFAHHSQAMFDDSRTMTLTGTVREFQFTNPHCYIQLLVPEANGAEEEWSIELGAPAHLLRGGWKAKTLKPGDKITVIVNPLKDGAKGGHYQSGTGADGKPLGTPS